MANKIIGNAIGRESDMQIQQQGQQWIFHKTWEWSYIVLAQDINQTEDDIAATSGIPAAGSIVNNAICKGVKAKETDRIIHPVTGVPTMLWQVTASFDSKIDPGQITEDATAIRPKRRIYTEKIEERVEVDWTGAEIVTSAGEPIVTEFPFPDIIMEIERYEAYPPNLSTLYTYIHSVNEATFYGCPIGSAYMDDIQIDEEYVQSEVLLKTRYVIRFRIRENAMGGFLEDTMRKYKPLNQGYLYKKTSTSKAETYIVKGQPIKVNLKADGTKLADGDYPTFGDFVKAPSADWSLLNLEF